MLPTLWTTGAVVFAEATASAGAAMRAPAMSPAPMVLATNDAAVFVFMRSSGFTRGQIRPLGPEHPKHRRRRIYPDTAKHLCFGKAPQTCINKK